MGMLNRVVNIVVLVLALGAAVMSFLLCKKREVLVTGWDKMAGCINQTASSLDAGSNTKYAVKLQKANITHKNFAELDKLLPELPKQAKTVIMQRDAFALAMKDIGTILELEGVAEADTIKSVEGFAGGKDKLLELVKKSQVRNNGLVEGFAASCKKVGVNTTSAELKDFEKYKDPVKNFDTKVTKIIKRVTSYESHIGQLASAIGTSSPSLGGDDFETSLKDTVTAAETLMNNFEQSKKDLANEKDRTRTTEAKLEEREQKIVSLEKVVTTKEQEITGLKRQVAQLSGNSDSKDGITILEDGDPRLLRFLKGKVVEMNDKWDFVVIDLGRHTKVKQKIGKREIENVVMLPANEEMVVARDLGEADNQFVGKIKITKVYDNCAIGNILPNPKGQAAVKVGDTVFFSDDAVNTILKNKEQKKTEEAKKAENGNNTTAAPEGKKEEKKDSDDSSSDDSSAE